MNGSMDLVMSDARLAAVDRAPFARPGVQHR
jgi:hypothetical protein